MKWNSQPIAAEPGEAATTKILQNTKHTKPEISGCPWFLNPTAMDAIGVGLSVPATIKLLVGVIRLCCDFADDIRDWNDGSRKLALRISLQLSLTQHLQNLLFGSAASRPNVDEPKLFDRLSPNLQRDVCSMINEFHNVVASKFNTLKLKYGLKSPGPPSLLSA
jgi:hypothetical protein